MRIYSFFILTFMLMIISVVCAEAQADYAQARKGDKSYEDGRYPDAETSYRKAQELKSKASTSYNLANSMFLQDRIPEALTEYQKVIASTEDPEIRSQAFYNMGNAYFQNNELEQSINAYKEALKINPADEDAKKNLMLAMRQLKQQQEQQQQNQQEQEQQQQQEQEEQQQQQNQGESPPQQEEKKREDISKEEASEILKAIEREDQRVQEKLKKTSGKSTPPVKDW